MLIANRFSRRDSPRITQRFGQVRSTRLRAMALPLVLMLAACAPPPPAPMLSDAPLPEVVARFDAPPDRLLDALPRLCTAPAQRITRPAPGITECRMLLGPEATATAILRYGGTIDRLPESVVRLRISEDADGYLVATAAYLEVPRAAGDVLRVVFPDPEMERRIARSLVNLGGTLP
ncbi:MAG: hypothetical protein V2I53_00885 [Paracoccaceae bacterium]|nr:hypothetical protein [Paracoccaceae bacterium]